MFWQVGTRKTQFTGMAKTRFESLHVHLTKTMADLRKQEVGTSANGPSWNRGGHQPALERPFLSLTCEVHASRLTSSSP
jgi:hypothetical protein